MKKDDFLELLKAMDYSKVHEVSQVRTEEETLEEPEKHEVN